MQSQQQYGITGRTLVEPRPPKSRTPDHLLADIFGSDATLILRNGDPTTETLDNIVEVAKKCIEQFKERRFSLLYCIHLLIQIAIGIRREKLLMGIEATLARCELDRFYKLKDLKKDSNYLPILTTAFGGQITTMIESILNGNLAKDKKQVFEIRDRTFICLPFVFDYVGALQEGDFPNEKTVIQMLINSSDCFKTSEKHALNLENEEQRALLLQELQEAVDFGRRYHIEKKSCEDNPSMMIELRSFFTTSWNVLWKTDKRRTTLVVGDPNPNLPNSSGSGIGSSCSKMNRTKKKTK